MVDFGALSGKFGKSLQKVFGSANERSLASFKPVVDSVNKLEDWAQQMDGAQIQARVQEWREKIDNNRVGNPRGDGGVSLAVSDEAAFSFDADEDRRHDVGIGAGVASIAATGDWVGRAGDFGKTKAGGLFVGRPLTGGRRQHAGMDGGDLHFNERAGRRYRRE